MKDELAIIIAARNNTLALLKPGASCADIWESHNRFMRDHHRPEEHRLYCHGQGYDLVERPLVRYDEPLRIKKNMNIVCHPGYLGGGFLNGLCDNYLIGANGVAERLHKLPEKLYELE
jgi:Xaa-Pro aminopeptidase